MRGTYCFDLPGAPRIGLALRAQRLTWLELAGDGTAAAWWPTSLDLSTAASAIEAAAPATPTDAELAGSATPVVLAYDVCATLLRHDSDRSGAATAADDEADVCLVAPTLTPVASERRSVPKRWLPHMPTIEAVLARMALATGLDVVDWKVATGRLRVRAAIPEAPVAASAGQRLAAAVSILAARLSALRLDVRIDVVDSSSWPRAAVATWRPDGLLERRTRWLDCVDVDLPGAVTDGDVPRLVEDLASAAQRSLHEVDWHNVLAGAAGLGFEPDLPAASTADSLGSPGCDHLWTHFRTQHALGTSGATAPQSPALRLWRLIATHAPHHDPAPLVLSIRHVASGRTWTCDGRRLRERKPFSSPP
ncbi:MAG: hypothetical protein EXR79_09810 [Myxococcales bacterium]|nr:hypothetical protein [Myxococcales bacterium]